MKTSDSAPEPFPPADKDPPGQGPRRLFVYGSLMEGFFNYQKSLEGKVVSRAPARARGLLRHQSAKGYPALVPGEGWVQGEFLELEDFETLIALCDRMENYSGPDRPGNEYERRVSAVELEGGGEEAAWIYWYARDDLGGPENPTVPVHSGDWREYLRESKSGAPPGQ